MGTHPPLAKCSEVRPTMFRSFYMKNIGDITVGKRPLNISRTLQDKRMVSVRGIRVPFRQTLVNHDRQFQTIRKFNRGIERWVLLRANRGPHPVENSLTIGVVTLATKQSRSLPQCSGERFL